MISVSPLCAAWCNVFHSLLSSQFTFAPFSRNYFTAGNLQLEAATISGVQPWPVFDSMLGKWVWIRSMISVSPPCAAKCNEFHPLLFVLDGSTPLLIRLFTAWMLTFTAAFNSSVLSVTFVQSRRGVNFILVTSLSPSAERDWVNCLLFSLTEVPPRIV